jgi:type II secretory pathway pseudopilin PulG
MIAAILPNRAARGRGRDQVLGCVERASPDPVPPAAEAGHGRRDQSGMSMLELFVTMVILVIMIYIVTNLSLSGSDAQRYAERLTRATELNQDLIDEMRRELGSSVRIMHNDAVGNAYANIIDLSPAAPRITSILPTLRPTGIFELEATTGVATGNQLMFARHAWTDRYTCNSTRAYRLDVYRIVCYYQKNEDGGPQPGSATGLNLCRFVGEPMVDATQVTSITDATDFAEVLQLLDDGRTTFDLVTQPEPIHDRVELVWLLGADPGVADTFRQIDPSSWTLSSTPLPPRNIAWRVLRSDALSSDSLLFYRHHSVATNYSPVAFGIGRFGRRRDTGDGFPHGLEVQVIGPAAARQVMLHLTLVSSSRQGRPAFSQIQAIEDCRDI